MMWFVIGTAMLVLAGVAVVAAGHGGGMEMDTERPVTVLPSDDLTPDDLRGVRFSAAVSGYARDEVDALLARVADQWQRGSLADSAPASGPVSGPSEVTLPSPAESPGEAPADVHSEPSGDAS